MKKVKAVVYTSNTGHTKEYADIIGSETGLPVFSLKAAKKELAKGTDIIYLGWLMAGTIKGYSKAAARFGISAVCAVGMAKTGSQMEDIKKTNRLPDGLPTFTLQGGLDMSKLKGVYKLMMTFVEKTAGKILEKKTDRTDEENEMFDMLINGGSRVDACNLAEFLAWYREEN